MKNAKIVQIEKAEKQTTVMVGQEKKMRRDFAADGIDAIEQKKLDAIGGKIIKLKDIVAKLRAEIENNKRIWEGRRSDNNKIQSQLGDLQDWGHADTGLMEGEIVQISDAVADERWADATAMLDQAQVSMAPVHEDYLTQFAAKLEYDPLRSDFDTRVQDASNAEPQTEAIASGLNQIANNLGAIDASVVALDYVTALELLGLAIGELETIEAAIILVQEQKAEFDAQWAALASRLQEMSFCEFPDLTTMQDEILAIQTQIETDATACERCGQET